MEICLYEKDYRKKVESVRAKQGKNIRTLDDEFNEKYYELINEYMEEPYNLLPNAYENLKLVQKKCDEYAKENMAYIKTEISVEHYIASITLKIPFLVFGKRELDLVNEIQDKLEKIIVFPLKYELNIDLCVNYFADKHSPAKKALDSIFSESEGG